MNLLKNLDATRLFKAFTLAEVLITLGIIGVVAEMTIPTVINSTKKQDIVVRVKKIYSTLSQATTMIDMDCGGDIQGCISSATSGDDNDSSSRAQVTTLYKEKLRIAKDCTDGVTTGCFTNKNYLNLNKEAWVNLSSVDFLTNSQIILSDGTSVGFDWNGPGFYDRLYSIHVDINGSKSPNQRGKDTFMFYYDANRKTLSSANEDDCHPSTVGVNGYGGGCTLKIIQEGEITYY